MDGGLALGDPEPLRLRVTRDQAYRSEVPLGVPDAMSRVAAEALARQLAPLRPSSSGPAEGDFLAATTTLTSLLGIADARAVSARDLWRPRAPRDLLRVPVGSRRRRRAVVLDIKESAQGGMGPHGLLIGATGSGKSELLRTIVLGAGRSRTHPSSSTSCWSTSRAARRSLGLDRLPHDRRVITNLADELPAGGPDAATRSPAS